MPAPTARASVAMSDAKGPKEWYFVKGVDAAGKENTYMYLDAKKGAEPDEIFLAKLLGLEDSPFAFVLSFWFIALFTPSLVAFLYTAVNVIAK